MAVIPSISVREESAGGGREGGRELRTHNANLLTTCEKLIPAPLSISFSMCSGLPWKADHMRGVIMAPSLKLPSRPGTCVSWCWGQGVIAGRR